MLKSQDHVLVVSVPLIIHIQDTERLLCTEHLGVFFHKKGRKPWKEPKLLFIILPTPVPTSPLAFLFEQNVCSCCLCFLLSQFKPSWTLLQERGLSLSSLPPPLYCQGTIVSLSSADLLSLGNNVPLVSGFPPSLLADSSLFSQ